MVNSMRTWIIICLLCVGCASRSSIDRAVILNKSLSTKVSQLNKFSKYPGVEDENSQIQKLTGDMGRNVILVDGCLKTRGGISNPICRADVDEMGRLVALIAVSAERATIDVDHSKASGGTKKAARKQFLDIPFREAQIDIILGQSGLLVQRPNMSHISETPRPRGP
jgi:hypothetical protein